MTPEDTIYATYDDQDRMLSYGDASYGYNAHGSLTYKAVAGDTTWYDYDLLGNLISVRMPDDTFVEYIIDGQNRRVGKVVDGVFQKGWLYQNQLNPVAELDGNGAISARFIYGTQSNVPDFMAKDGQIYRFVCDHLGSVRLVVNTTTGDIIQRIDYDVFGNMLINTNEGFQPFGFAGGLLDEETKLVKFGARDYDSETGSWTSKDPIGFAGGQGSLYAYVYNDPINFIDPSGLNPCESKSSKILDYIQTGLDLAGLVPGFGEFFDLANAAIYFARGDMVNAGLSAAAMVPVAGWAATGGKFATKGLKAATKFGPDATTLLGLARRARKTGIDAKDAETLLTWAKEYGVEPALDHIGTKHWVRGSHIRIGPVNHIPVR